MANAGTVTLNLDANSIRLLRELKKAQRQTEKTAKGMRKSMTKGFDGIARSAKNAAAAFGIFYAARTIRGIAQAGIEMERLERKFRFVAGSAEGAASEFQFLRTETNRLGLDLRSAGDAYASLAAAAKGSALEGMATRRIFTSISQASRVMGLSIDQTEGALRAIEQMISKGNVQAEELRGQLGERLPGAFQIAARAMGKTTQELNKMLDNGEVLAADLLPKLSDELDRMFDAEIDAAANSAEAAFARFGTAVFELSASFAQSGLLDNLATAANFMRFLIEGMPEGNLDVFGREIDPAIGENIEKLTKDIENYTAGLARLEVTKISLMGNSGLAVIEADVKRLEELLAQARIALKGEKVTQIELQTGTNLTKIDPLSLFKGRDTQFFTIAIKDAEKAEIAFTKLVDGFKKSFETAAQEVARKLEEFSVVEHMFPPGEQERIRKEIREILDVEEIDISDFAALKKTIDLTKGGLDDLSEFSKQAAANMQDAFAEFLFNPFEDGLSGMVKGFSEAIQRMLANAAAAQLFNFIANSFGSKALTEIPKSASMTRSTAGFLGSLPGRALGGPVSAGGSYMVGEQGPELFVPNNSGSIVANGAGGVVVNQTYKIEAGADWETLEKVLPPLMDSNREQTKAEIRDLMAQGRF
jgi:tape measure domain-containing protein